MFVFLLLMYFLYNSLNVLYNNIICSLHLCFLCFTVVMTVLYYSVVRAV